MSTFTVAQRLSGSLDRRLRLARLILALALALLVAAPTTAGGSERPLANPDPEEAAIAALCGEVSADNLALGDSVEVEIRVDRVEGVAGAYDADREQDIDCRGIAEQLVDGLFDPAGCAVLGRGEQIVAVAPGCSHQPSAGKRPDRCTIRARAAIIGTAGYAGSSIFVEAICYDVFSDARATVPRGGGLDSKVGHEARADAKATCKIKVTLRGSGGTFVAWGGRCW
jgi:hypothetical protein